MRHDWDRQDKEYAKAYLDYWLSELKRFGFDEMKQAARMLSKHLPNILTYFERFITNAISEGLNSKIQSLKGTARGFRNFENYRSRILFFCGKLNLAP